MSIAYQNPCESTDLCLTGIWSQVVPDHIHSYRVRHGDLSSLVHLAKAASDPHRLQRLVFDVKRKDSGAHRAYNIATICFIGSLVATPLSSSSTSVANARDDTIVFGVGLRLLRLHVTAR